ncbi:MAG: hypothetical protein ACYC7D_15275 [Nitrososphaerales archaeon]
MPSPDKKVVLEGNGKFVNRRTKTYSKDYDRFFLYVPVEIARDSGFPFKPDEVVKIKIDRKMKRLLVEKLD